jgi:hypothetical protein
MRKKILLFIAINMLQFNTASALAMDEDNFTLPEPQVSEQSPDVTYVSGGVGDLGKEEIEALQRQYNLKLLFASTGGNYLGDVNVDIADKKGRTLLSTVTDGPFLLVKLKPGRYTVTAHYDDAVQRKRIVVGAGALKTYDFHMNTHDE